MYALSSSTAPVAETPAPVTAMARAYSTYVLAAHGETNISMIASGGELMMEVSLLVLTNAFVRPLGSGIISLARESVLVAADGHGGGKEQNDGEREERRPAGAHCTQAVLKDMRSAMLQPRTQNSMLCARLGV